VNTCHGAFLGRINNSLKLNILYVKDYFMVKHFPGKARIVENFGSIMLRDSGKFDGAVPGENTHGAVVEA